MGFRPKKEEHAFRRIEADLRSGRIKNAILLCGPEEYLVRFYAKRLAAKYVNPATRAIDLVSLTAENSSAQSIIESCETLSLISERKVVLVSDFILADGRTVRGFNESELDRIIEYLPDVPDATLLMFTSGELDSKKGDTRFRKAMKKAGQVYDFQPLDDGLLRGFIEKRLKATGREYRNSVINAIISESGYGNRYVEYTLLNLDNDLKKLAAYCNGNEITVDDVRAVITVSPENNIFSLIDSVAQNKKADALLMAHNLFNAKVDAFMIQAMIVSQLELILMSKELAEKGYKLRDICTMTNNKSEFKVKKALGFAKKYSRSSIRHMLIGAYAIDRNVKTGTFSSELAIEYYISSI